jgi:oxygen-independent coproporphyrinogen-3 oxidase
MAFLQGSFRKSEVSPIFFQYPGQSSIKAFYQSKGSPSVLTPQAPLGIYLHIPYCAALCHYCDFAKTAHWDSRHTEAYFSALALQLEAWCGQLLPRHFHQIDTLNIGGGTPSLFAEEYRPLLARLRPFFTADAELSLEANPADIVEEKLQLWKELGFNRLSLGVQTFHAAGLALLKRDHGAAEAKIAIERALTVFANLNVDLIYNWPGQSLENFAEDLQRLISMKVPHLSLYDLCYPAKTPIGRQLQRGKLVAPPEAQQEGFYQHACNLLADAGYVQDEVSNWSLPNFSCAHNWRYWQGEHYLGVGAGAHGFLPAAEHRFGLRYSYGPSDRLFSKLQSLAGDYRKLSAQEAGHYGIQLEQRNAEAWLFEYIGSATRCRMGLDLEKIAAISSYVFTPKGLVADALRQGTLLREGNRLRLQPREWIRETAWCGELLECFAMPGE